jgi:integrase/recombinase XerD
VEEPVAELNLPVPVHAFKIGAIPAQAENDARVVDLWVHGRPRRTRRIYMRDVGELLRFAGVGLREMRMVDVQDWLDTLQGAPATVKRKLAAVKSLFTFADRIGYLALNVAAAIRGPTVVQQLAERILGEGEVVRMIAMERDPRNHAILRLLYLGALRVSELCGLRWKDVKVRRGEEHFGGQVTVLGKRQKLRAIMLPKAMWRELVDLKVNGAGDDDPVFVSREARPLTARQVHRIVKAAAIRAGLSPAVSPHWLRHAHCSHALERGANPALVRDTAGHADLKVTSIYAHARPNDSSARHLIG